ncbi:hypothetical protein [Mesorhizobium helmanticense]|uniref:hypothetical protein n=1 Tax=Mesorhizobium helmanticense TaxID=1776423 RepID=UPI0011B21C42|nr:hypothetical protein [Mesorhizobium helmanticense]
MRDMFISPISILWQSGFLAPAFVLSAKHHSGAGSSTKTITINGAGWPISDTLAAFWQSFSDQAGVSPMECPFPVECRDAPSPRQDKSA